MLTRILIGGLVMAALAVVWLFVRRRECATGGSCAGRCEKTCEKEKDRE